MASKKDQLFSFNADNFPKNTFGVVSFKGSEEIGELYRYEIDLVSKKDDIDFDKMLKTEVSLQLHNKDKDDIYIHGVLEFFEAHQKIDEYIYYKAYLVPKLWWLSIAQHQQIFLDKKIDEIMESILKDAKFTSDDYELRLQGTYNKREYVCHYKESRYDFLRRWMEREGIYFYFEQDENGCKVIITDAKEKHQKLPQMDTLRYEPTSGMQENHEQEVVQSIVYRSNNTIKGVRMKNYNYEKPSLSIDSSSQSSPDDHTQTYLFGNNINTKEEADKLSQINAEKYSCQAKKMYGESNIISLRPGYIYTLSNYFRDDLNDDYLMLKMEIEGYQDSFVSSGLSKGAMEPSYLQNNFVMIPAKTQFRMPSTTPWPQVSGMISATIDGQGIGDTAEVDKDGRYKVIMPFDVSGRKDAKASAYMRMAQPSAGEKQGIHFPLHKGAEVLIAFKSGDPDQPIITGAVPNINSPSPVNDQNVTKSVIQTHGGNIIHMEDTPGKAHIKMAVHDDLTKLTLHNEDEDEHDPESGWGYQLVSTKGIEIQAGGKNEIILGEVFDMVAGATVGVKILEVLEITVAFKEELMLGAVFSFQAAGGIEVATAGVTVINPETIELNALKTEVHENRTIIDDNTDEIAANHTGIMDNYTMIGVEKQSLIDNELKALQDRVLVVENTVRTVEDDMEIAANLIVAVNDKVEAVETKVEVNEVSISEAETQLKHSSVLLEDYTSKLTDSELEVIACELSLIQ